MTSTGNNARQDREPPAPARKRWIGWTLAGLVGIGLIHFFGGEAPAEVDLDATVNAVQTTVTEPASQSTSLTPESGTIAGSGGDTTESPTDVSGTWSVDTTTGTFNFEAATASFAGFRVEEELAQIGAATAVGRTPDVSGTVTIDGTTITQARSRSRVIRPPSGRRVSKERRLARGRSGPSENPDQTLLRFVSCFMQPTLTT